MKKNYKPDKYYQNIESINYKLLKDENIKVILFDLDNTIADNRDKFPRLELVKLFKKIHKMGFVTYILSNALPRRVKRYASILESEALPFSCKPLSYNYKKVLLKHKKENIAAVGDQIYTDILGAKKNGIKTILVDRISAFESIQTYFNRLKEKLIIERKGIIKRGEYYE
jgi:HAD superfamily phosphatase (TIGR01668 family)